jgi:hypothetical protein
LVLDLAEWFHEFADVCARFSTELLGAVPEFAHLSPSDNLELNLQIARTRFRKWSVAIVSLLYTNRNAGFQEIRKALCPITSGVLSKELRELRKAGLIQREVLPTNPPRVQYSLTEKGHCIAKLAEPFYLYLRFIEGLLVGKPANGGKEPPQT